MICKHCHSEIDHQREASLQGSGSYLEIVVSCPDCGAEHFDSIKAENLILNENSLPKGKAKKGKK